MKSSLVTPKPINNATIVFHALLLLLIAFPTIQSTDLIIDQVCKKTPFYELCMSSLEPNSGSMSKDVKGLSSIMANLILSNASDTLSYIQGLIKQSSDPQEEQDLADCAELYIPVVKYNLPQAIDAISRGRFGFASYVISDAGKQAETCEKGFSGGDRSPLSDRNELLSDLCNVAVAIIRTLVKEQRKG